MPARLTTEEFIIRARRKHGDKYDYSRVEYVNGSTDVIIICPIHGEFLQTPENHQRNGCKTCSGNVKITTEIFVARAREKYGDKYDYSKTIYVNTRSKVIIICPEHGLFERTPNAHLSGNQGCPKCAQITTKTFIERARSIHGDKYDYSLVEYINSHSKVTIVCLNHGKFDQAAYSHLNARGCPKCAISSSRSTTEKFVERAREIHGDKYDYSLTEYEGSNKKITIICPEHNIYYQLANSHLAGRGCKECANNSTRSTAEDFIKKAREVHGDKYDYSLVEYKNNMKKVIIICPKGHEYAHPPQYHLRGGGCTVCIENSRMTTETFIERARRVHGNKFDYSLTDYKNTHTKISILCLVGHKFYQLPHDHLRGNGCGRCSGSLPLTTEIYIEKARTIHGNDFDYSMVEYKGAKTKIVIMCSKRHKFEQFPHDHLRSKMCPKCAPRHYSKIAIQWLKQIEQEKGIELRHALHDDGERKIGYFDHNWKLKHYFVDGYHGESKTVYEFHGDLWHGNPKFYNPDDVNPLSKVKYGLLMKRTLHKELQLRRMKFNYVCIWEHEFKRQLKEAK